MCTQDSMCVRQKIGRLGVICMEVEREQGEEEFYQYNAMSSGELLEHGMPSLE